MTSGQKTALSVLISVMLFGAFAVAAFAGLFSAIDARFYEPAKISQIDKKLQDISAAYDDYLKTLNERFALGQNAFLKNSSVQTFVEAKPSDQDVLSRGEALGELRSGTQGFLGLRVLDKNQNSIHYSTFHSDILRRDEKNNLTAYKNYLECLSLSGKEEIAAQIVSCSDTGGDLDAGKKIYFDQENRIVISFPLYDRYSVFRGSAIFYVNALDFANVLLKKNFSPREVRGMPLLLPGRARRVRPAHRRVFVRGLRVDRTPGIPDSPLVRRQRVQVVRRR